MQKLRSAIVGLLALIAASPVLGQGGINNYPQTVPAQTLVGRLGISPGPTSAIPISTLATVFGSKQSVTTNAKCDGATDDTSAINADLAQGGYWTLPPNKTCNVTQLNITVSGTRLSGSGFNTSILQGTSATVPVINITAGLSNVYLDGFQVTNNKIASSGSYGIRMNGDCQYCVLDSIFVQKQFVGIAVQSAGVAYMRHVLSQFNLSHGIQLTNSAASGTVQWDLDDVFSGQNVGTGLIVTNGSGGPTAITLGGWHNIRTFANSARGIAVSCSVSMPCNGFRLSKGFVGQDGDHEILLDTYGGLHVIGGVTYVELSSTGATGPTLGTPASHAGDGIRVTANNLDVTISDTYVNGNWNNGINSSATASTNISATEISNNGVYGLFSGNCALLTVTGSIFVSNTTANLNCNTNSGSQIIVGSRPNSLNTTTFPTATRAGDVIYWNGSGYVTIPGNNSGTNCLAENSSGVPSWLGCVINGASTSVGIGDTSPQSTLVVNKNTTNAIPTNSPLFTANGQDGQPANFTVQSFGTGVNPAVFQRAARGTAASPTASQSGDVLSFFAGIGYATSTYDTAAASGFYVGAGENHSTSAQGTFLSFLTVPNTTLSRAEAMRVQGSGGVSVGTTADAGIGTLILKKQTFASLTACSSTIEGAMASVTDSATAVWGATITGSSTNHVLAYCDGTAWTVAGK